MKSLIGIQESADQAGCGTNWTAGTNQTSSCTETHKHLPNKRQHREIEQKGRNNANVLERTQIFLRERNTFVQERKSVKIFFSITMSL